MALLFELYFCNWVNIHLIKSFCIHRVNICRPRHFKRSFLDQIDAVRFVPNTVHNGASTNSNQLGMRQQLFKLVLLGALEYSKFLEKCSPVGDVSLHGLFHNFDVGLFVQH
jgi:hypothetical protein